MVVGEIRCQVLMISQGFESEITISCTSSADRTVIFARPCLNILTVSLSSYNMTLRPTIFRVVMLSRVTFTAMEYFT